MREYQDAYRDFSVRQLAREVLHGSLADGINAAIECCDRWADGDHAALNWISKDFAEERVITFARLRDQSARFASLLRARGIERGDVVGWWRLALGESALFTNRSSPPSALRPLRAGSPPLAEVMPSSS